MSKYVILEHHHDADAGVYRLVFVTAVDQIVNTWVDNPDYDEEEELDEESNWPLMVAQETSVAHIDPREVVWADDDPQWADMSPEDVASAQRQILSDHLTQLVAEREQDEMRRLAAVSDLGGVGTEL